jgi:hypothetical protein
MDVRKFYDLDRQERKIEDALANSDQVAATLKALGHIRDEGLYRETHDSFEAYCVDVHGIPAGYVGLTMAVMEASLRETGNSNQEGGGN